MATNSKQGDNPTVTMLDVRGAKVNVWLTTNAYSKTASFCAELHSTFFSADTLEKLYAALMTKSRKTAVKVRVPFERLSAKSYSGEAYVRRGIATGIHAGTGKILVQWLHDDGTPHEREQVDSYYDCYRPLTDEERKEVVEARRVADAAEARFSEIAKKLKPEGFSAYSRGSLGDMVSAAVKKAADELAAVEGNAPTDDASAA